MTKNCRGLAAIALCAAATLLCGAKDLAPDEMTLLHDPAGWAYVSMDDSQNGFPTQHTCFDGSPHPDACSGKLTLSPNNTFVQQVVINGQSVSRRGTYELNGDQLAFFDEFGTRDGPYTIDMDVLNKLLKVDMPQIKIRLMLYKEYRKQLDAAQKRKKSR